MLSLSSNFLFSFFNLVLQPGIEPWPLAVKAPSPNHQTAREFPFLQSSHHYKLFPISQSLYTILWNISTRSSNSHEFLFQLLHFLISLSSSFLFSDCPFFRTSCSCLKKVISSLISLRELPVHGIGISSPLLSTEHCSAVYTKLILQFEVDKISSFLTNTGFFPSFSFSHCSGSPSCFT